MIKNCLAGLLRSICLIVVITFCSTAATAEDEWRNEVVLYLVGAAIDGRVGIGSVEADIQMSFDEILDNLDSGIMLAYRLEHGLWAVSADLIYMGLAAEKGGLGPLGNTTAKADFDETIFELAAYYSLNKPLAVYGGLRYWGLDGSVTVATVIETRTADGSQSWIDPLIGLRYEHPLGKKWDFVARGDVGGFGIGSDFAWHATMYAAWYPVPQATVFMGIRYLDADYEDGSGSDRFLWDVAQGGPALGFGWAF